jgi:hypothetical protein
MLWSFHDFLKMFFIFTICEKILEIYFSCTRDSLKLVLLLYIVHCTVNDETVQGIKNKDPLIWVIVRNDLKHVVQILYTELIDWLIIEFQPADELDHVVGLLYTDLIDYRVPAWGWDGPHCRTTVHWFDCFIDWLIMEFQLEDVLDHGAELLYTDLIDWLIDWL